MKIRTAIKHCVEKLAGQPSRSFEFVDWITRPTSSKLSADQRYRRHTVLSARAFIEFDANHVILLRTERFALLYMIQNERDR